MSDAMNCVEQKSGKENQPEEMPIIMLKGVNKVYEVGENKVEALKDIHLEIPAGEFVGILGKSGAGKSTLLNMISGVDKPTSGEVYVCGGALHKMNETECSKWRGKNIGVIYQSFQLLASLTLIDNVLFPIDFLGSYHPVRSVERGLNLLQRMQIGEHALKYPSQISGGQQQRVAIARALANDAPILIADEPTGSLDSITAAAIMKVFEEILQEGKTIIMATHDSTLAAHFTKTIHIMDGEIISVENKLH